MNDKEFDAVKMMRDIRDRLSIKYAEDPDAEERDLEKIRKKYKIKKDSHSSEVHAVNP
ncbi:MAG: hypothetical protein HXS54_00115 [Theionarchaea archaeon]|nr:hypothetical protein [Theionarchaea archaeon]